MVANILSQAQVEMLSNKKYKEVLWHLLKLVVMQAQPLNPK